MSLTTPSVCTRGREVGKMNLGHLPAHQRRQELEKTDCVADIRAANSMSLNNTRKRLHDNEWRARPDEGQSIDEWVR